MLAGAPREAALGRRARAACRFCGRFIELSRMRSHLRAVHDLGSAELENLFLEARKSARRTSRAYQR